MKKPRRSVVFIKPKGLKKHPVPTRNGRRCLAIPWRAFGRSARAPRSSPFRRDREASGQSDLRAPGNQALGVRRRPMRRRRRRISRPPRVFMRYRKPVRLSRFSLLFLTFSFMVSGPLTYLRPSGSIDPGRNLERHYDGAKSGLNPFGFSSRESAGFATVFTSISDAFRPFQRRR